jgi:hypothetical protein
VTLNSAEYETVLAVTTAINQHCQVSVCTAVVLTN